MFCTRPGTDENLTYLAKIMLGDKDLFLFPVERGDKKSAPFTKPLKILRWAQQWELGIFIYEESTHLVK